MRTQEKGEVVHETTEPVEGTPHCCNYAGNQEYIAQRGYLGSQELMSDDLRYDDEGEVWCEIRQERKKKFATRKNVCDGGCEHQEANEASEKQYETEERITNVLVLSHILCTERHKSRAAEPYRAFARWVAMSSFLGLGVPIR